MKYYCKIILDLMKFKKISKLMRQVQIKQYKFFVKAYFYNYIHYIYTKYFKLTWSSIIYEQYTNGY